MHKYSPDYATMHKNLDVKVFNPYALIIISDIDEKIIVVIDLDKYQKVKV